MPQQAEAAGGIIVGRKPHAETTWGIIVGNPQAAATLTELRFPSPGLRAKHATLGKRPTNLATLTELRLAVGVTCNVYVNIP